MANEPPAATPPRSERLGRTFHRFWAAGTLTNLGDGMLATALPLIAATLTHDPLAVSGLMVARFLPWLLVAPFTGVLLDRVDRLRAMAVSSTVAAVAVAALAVVIATGQVTMWAMYATLFVVICCETVTDPVTRITVSRIVPGRLLDRANSRMEGGRLVAQDCVATPVAGVLFAVAAVLPVAGTAVSYGLCAVLVVTVALMLRRVPGAAGATESGEGTESGQGVLRSMREGFAYVFGRPLTRGLAFNNAACMIGLQMSTSVLVLYAQDVLGVPAALYGLFLASIAIGGVLGTVLVSRAVTGLGRRAVMMGGYLGMGLCLLAVGLVSNAWFAALAWTLLGLCMTMSNVAGSLFFQAVIPSRVRGRAAAAFRMVGWGLSPVGALLGGLLGRIDLALPFLAGGLVMVVTPLVFRRAVAECARLSDEATVELAADQDR
ncbi:MULTISPECIES: MFS transporter [Nocardiopsis]|uniref:MFS transporter n=1 Tax=Nocardiopsis sinuspersici TaxID=501010 RepID=A0A1V3C122_9ACTN|nr:MULTISPECIES: MFS transporter [Nocardiopsis]OOC54501.1 MFS transporter [Nocardiopsis sinuspersici]